MSSQKKVQKVMEVLLDEYINPFGMYLDKAKLVNLNSGAPVDDAVVKVLLHVYDNGNIQAELFRKERLVNKTSLFHDPVKRCGFVNFKETSKSVSIRKDNKTLSLKVNRNIIGALFTYSAKSGNVIDLEKALMYSLSPIPLSIFNKDGTSHVTSKSKLLQCIKLVRNETALPPKDTITDYIIDIMALIRTLEDIPTTFEELVWKIVKTLPSGYRSMHITADTSQEISTKSSKREKRGSSSKIFIKSVGTMVPRKFHEFLQKGCNKTRLIELLFEYLQLNKNEGLQTSGSNDLILSSDNSCVVVCSYGRFKFVEQPIGSRDKDYSALCKCPSQKPWGECMLMVPMWQHRQLFWLLDYCKNLMI